MALSGFWLVLKMAAGSSLAGRAWSFSHSASYFCTHERSTADSPNAQWAVSKAASAQSRRPLALE